jgi:hypothetical protein
MADDRDSDEKFDKGIEKQSIGGQQSHESEYGRQGGKSPGAEGQPIGGNDNETGSGTPLSQGAEPPRSMGTRGTEFGQMSDHDRSGQQGQSGTGQADLGSQAGSTLSGHTDQQDLGEIGGEVDQPASYGGGIGGRQSTTEGEGFILQQGAGTDNQQQRDNPASAKATGGTDFAAEGRGAPENEGDEADEGSGGSA